MVPLLLDIINRSLATLEIKMAMTPSNELDKVLRLLQKRREFLRFSGMGLGYGAMATVLPACGGGGGNSSGGTEPEPTPPPIPGPGPDPSPLPKPSPEYTALKRTSFGPHRDTLAAINSDGIDAFLEQQLNYTDIDVSALETEIAARFPQTLATPAQLILGFPDNIYQLATQMIAAAQYRQMFSERQLYEVMVEFWSDHFNIHLINGLCPTLKPSDDQQVIRQHALGNFRELLHASAKSPAMLFYLDNFLSVVGNANENYARELMELHTLGVDGGYTEGDVKEVARCFTGWSLRFPDDPDGAYGEFVFQNLNHDNAEKIILGNQIPAGGGQKDGEQVLDILASHPSTANFIATKLCQRFISDTPEQVTIDAVASAFINSDGDIKATLRALFSTPAFVDTADHKITRPSEYLAGLVRSLAPDTSYPPDQGVTWFYAQNILGQIPFYWPTPDGYPDQQSYWASTGGLLNRWRLSFLSFAGIIPDLNVIQIDYSLMLNGANTLDTVVDAITAAVLMRPLASDDRSTVLDWLTAELGISADTALPMGVPEQAAALLAAVLISSPYFQLR